MKVERLTAICKDVHVGMRDCNRPVLWFTVYVNESLASLQVLEWEEAGRAIKNAEVYDLKGLEGRACYIDDEGGYMRFVSFWRK